MYNPAVLISQRDFCLFPPCLPFPTTQAIFFRGAYTTESGLIFMGVMIICCTLPVTLLYFPQWGGMLLPASRKVEATEENYYLGEYAEEERTESKHEACLKVCWDSSFFPLLCVILHLLKSLGFTLSTHETE